MGSVRFYRKLAHVFFLVSLWVLISITVLKSVVAHENDREELLYDVDSDLQKTYSSRFHQSMERFSFSEIEELDSEISEHAGQYYYLFVPGFLYEIGVTYFTDIQAELRLILGAQHQNQIETVMQRSNNSLFDNEVLIRQAILRVMKNFPHLKIIVIAHSRGASASFHALLSDDEILKSTYASFLIQGPYFGAPLARAICHGHESTSVQSRILLKLTKLISFFFLDTIKELGTCHLEEKMLEYIYFLNRHPQANGTDESNAMGGVLYPQDRKQLMLRKVFFITGNSTLENTHVLLRPFMEFVGPSQPSDGQVLTMDQRVVGFGTTLYESPLDHFSFVFSRPFSTVSYEVRRAFTRSLVQFLFDQRQVGSVDSH